MLKRLTNASVLLVATGLLLSTAQAVAEEENRAEQTEAAKPEAKKDPAQAPGDKAAVPEAPPGEKARPGVEQPGPAVEAVEAKKPLDETPATETEPQPAPQKSIGKLQFFHQPQLSALPGSSIKISTKLHQVPRRVRIVLRYRQAPDGKWKELAFRRSAEQGIVVEIPGAEVQSPGLDYYIASILTSPGQPLPGAPGQETTEPDQLLFASPDYPHRVLVRGYTSGELYAKRKAEHKGRLSRIEAYYGYTDFGLNLQESEDGLEDEMEETSAGNIYHEISLNYTFRLLTVLYSINVEIAGLSQQFSDFKPFDEERSPGMYFISPSGQFEFHRFFGADVLLRLGISEEEFEWGAGTSIRIGRMNGTRLDFGFEGMTHAGWRVFLRFTWDTVPYVPMSLTTERTQWYAASSNAVQSWGTILAYEAHVNLPAGIGVHGRIGYAARDESVEGGLVAGGGLTLEF